jgi:hypothetical protein
MTTHEILNKRPLLRPGIDHDPVAPWVWGSYKMREPIEVMSFACPARPDGIIDDEATLMIRTTPGDPTTLIEVPLKDVACFDRSRHQDDKKYPELGS